MDEAEDEGEDLGIAQAVGCPIEVVSEEGEETLGATSLLKKKKRKKEIKKIKVKKFKRKFE